jgi:hypothetical protein
MKNGSRRITRGIVAVRIITRIWRVLVRDAHVFKSLVAFPWRSVRDGGIIEGVMAASKWRKWRRKI